MHGSFQGYPQEFLSVTVTGIPSMHICLDFVPELLRQPEIEKQVKNWKVTYSIFRKTNIFKHTYLKLVLLWVFQENTKTGLSFDALLISFQEGNYLERIFI